MEKKNKDIKILNIPGTNVSKEDRLIEDHKKLLKVLEFFRRDGLKIVYTMGVYDLFHIGHARYLQKAKDCGDILVVGLDSDELTHSRKPGRPIVPYDERWETLVHNRSVNIVTILRTDEEAVELMQKMKPDVVVLSYSSATEDFETYEKRMKEKYGKYCKEVKIFDRQAETSTSARMRQVIMDGSKGILEVIQNCVDVLKNEYDKFFKMNGGQ
jgi:D-beta-D-heptose 7-phosphate kinase/D-beta-D-heptose 1-phosphate adenosyltransferase